MSGISSTTHDACLHLRQFMAKSLNYTYVCKNDCLSSDADTFSEQHPALRMNIRELYLAVNSLLQARTLSFTQPKNSLLAKGFGPQEGVSGRQSAEQLRRQPHELDALRLQQPVQQPDALIRAPPQVEQVGTGRHQESLHTGPAISSSDNIENERSGTAPDVQSSSNDRNTLNGDWSSQDGSSGPETGSSELRQQAPERSSGEVQGGWEKSTTPETDQSSPHDLQSQTNSAQRQIISSQAGESETLQNPLSNPQQIEYDNDHGLIRLRPCGTEQCQDFPSLLARACELGAHDAGVFKYVLPTDNGWICTPRDRKETRASTYQHSPGQCGTYDFNRQEATSLIEIVPVAADEDVLVSDLVSRFEGMLRRPKGFQDVRYCTDLDARSVEERTKVGLPVRSPIWPLQLNQLERTKFRIPGLHWPMAYKAHKTFGAPFTLHKEDGDIPSINVLYFGQKVWTVTAPSAVHRLETRIKATRRHLFECAQFVRHCSTYIPSSTLAEWDIPYLTFVQRPHEVVVIMPHAYHQGFSTGSTLAEAVNYAPLGWSICSYAECNSTCPGFPIPNAMLEFRTNGDELQLSADEAADEAADDEEEEEPGEDQAASGNTERSRKERQRRCEAEEEQHNCQQGPVQHRLRRTSRSLQRLRKVHTPQIRGGAQRSVVTQALIRSSTKRHHHDVSETSTKRRKVGDDIRRDLASTEQMTMPPETPKTPDIWHKWDQRRESDYSQDQRSKYLVKAASVYGHLLPGSTSSSISLSARRRGCIVVQSPNSMVTMVLAVANAHAFAAVKEVMLFLQQHQTLETRDIFSRDPRVLFQTMTNIETSDNLNCYLRRYTLARLAQVYFDTVANRGQLPSKSEVTIKSVSSASRPSSNSSSTNANKALAYQSLIHRIWEVPYPSAHGVRRTRRGTINSDAPEAQRWNKYKRKLLKQLDAGKRWLRLAERFGWSVLALITKDWAIGGEMSASDRIFEQTLTIDEFSVLLDEVDNVKGEFLRGLTKDRGGSLFDCIQDRGRAQRLRILQLADEDIMRKPDCDPRWADSLKLCLDGSSSSGQCGVSIATSGQLEGTRT